MSDSTNPVSDAGTTDNAATATEAPVVQATDVTSTIAPSIAMSPKWIEAIQPLVSRLGLTALEVTQAILTAKLVKIPNDDAVDVLTDPDSITNEDFSEAFPTATKGDLRRAVLEMRATGKPAPATAAAQTPGIPQVLQPAVMTMATFVIPDIPEGEGLLSALSSTKSLTVDVVTIRAALEAYFADLLGVEAIPEKLADAMESHAKAMEEPVGELFMQILDIVRQRKYADVNVDSRWVTKARKEQFLQRLRGLPVALKEFHGILSGWAELLKANKMSNPFGVLGGADVYPPCEEVIGASDIVVRCLTRSFAGFGVQVARALAYESIKIRDTLLRPELPALTGYTTRELMLAGIGVRLTDSDDRMERAFAKYALFVATEVPKNLPPGQEGRALEALYNLGQPILPWIERVTSGRDGGRSDNGRVESPFPLGGDSHDGRRRGSRGDGSYRE